ncbi:hypothetical protein MRX96_011412 [Rhipicephalus microplus]
MLLTKLSAHTTTSYVLRRVPFLQACPFASSDLHAAVGPLFSGAAKGSSGLLSHGSPAEFDPAAVSLWGRNSFGAVRVHAKWHGRGSVCSSLECFFFLGSRTACTRMRAYASKSVVARPSQQPLPNTMACSCVGR